MNEPKQQREFRKPMIIMFSVITWEIKIKSQSKSPKTRAGQYYIFLLYLLLFTNFSDLQQTLKILTELHFDLKTNILKIRKLNINKDESN